MHINKNYDIWWKYLINVIKERNKEKKPDIIAAVYKTTTMFNYINLYKRKQNIVCLKILLFIKMILSFNLFLDPCTLVRIVDCIR